MHAIRPHGGGILSTTYILYMLLVVSRYLLHSVEEADSKKSTSRVFLTEYEIYLLCDIISKFESSVIDWYVSCRERAMVWVFTTNSFIEISRCTFLLHWGNIMFHISLCVNNKWQYDMSIWLIVHCYQWNYLQHYLSE